GGIQKNSEGALTLTDRVRDVHQESVDRDIENGGSGHSDLAGDELRSGARSKPSLIIASVETDVGCESDGAGITGSSLLNVDIGAQSLSRRRRDSLLDCLERSRAGSRVRIVASRRHKKGVILVLEHRYHDAVRSARIAIGAHRQIEF